MPPVEATDVEAARREGQRNLPAVRVPAEDEVDAARGGRVEIGGVVREQDGARRGWLVAQRAMESLRSDHRSSTPATKRPVETTSPSLRRTRAPRDSSIATSDSAEP